jgi:hypothetical protein
MTSLWTCRSLLVITTITIVAFISTVSCQTQCTNVALTATGNAQNLTSPNYPSNYSSNANCRWTIRAASSLNVIVLNLLDFDLEGSRSSCAYDYVTIYDGSSIMTQQLCGQVTPTQFISTGSYLTVVLHSDSNTTYRGFRFEYTSVTKSALCQNYTIFSNDSSWYVTSPGYPYNYTSNVDCSWTLTADSPSEVVLLKFLDFYLEGYYPSCVNDYVAIYDGRTIYSSLIRKLCGQVSNTLIVGSGMYMTVVFHSDSSENFKGFKLETLSQNRSDVCYNSRLSATENPKYLMSPNYPNNYTSNTDCQTTISAASSSEEVVLRLSNFELEDSATCIYDYVAVYDGSSRSSPLLKKLCGQANSQPFISTGSYLTVVFHSNQMTNLAGFKFEYTSQTKSDLCTHFTQWHSSTENYITSPGYPYTYTSNLDCNWLITANSSSVVVVNIIYVSMEGTSQSCYDDYVTFHDGYNSSSHTIKTMCGAVSTALITSSGDYLYIAFHSDASVYSDGFAFSYTYQSRPAQCSDVRLTASISSDYFNSSNYPGQYPSNMDCKWLIKADSTSSIVVLFISAFSLESSYACTSDYVKIYDGPSTSSSLKETLCGSQSYETYRSTGSDMTVVFHSDGVKYYNYNSGFKFSYRSEEPVSGGGSGGGSDYSYDSSSSSYNIPGIAIGTPVGCILFIISAACCRRRVVVRRLRATQVVRTTAVVRTQVIATVQSATPAPPAPAPRPAPPPPAPAPPAQNTTASRNQTNVIVFNIVSNNSTETASASTGTSGTQQTTQAPSEPPRYSSLSSDMNAGLPNYDPRDPSYRTMNPPPAYSEVAGGAAPYEHGPLPYDPRPDTSRYPPPTGGGSHVNLGFSNDTATWAPRASYRSPGPSAPMRDSYIEKRY